MEYRDNYSNEISPFMAILIEMNHLQMILATLEDFPGNIGSFKFKQKITCKTENNSTKMLM